jgi:cobalt/nickel transport system permease protein
MQPIHLAIGIVEGLVTAAILTVVHRARPEVLATSLEDKPYRGAPLRPLILGGIVLALVAGGLLSRYASAWPDGLEWSLAKASGKAGLAARGAVHGTFAGTSLTGILGGGIVIVVVLLVGLVVRLVKKRETGADA